MAARALSPLRRRLVAAISILAAFAACVAAAPAKELPAETLLRRADLVRNPVLGVALDLDLEVVETATGLPLRRSRFLMLTRRGGRTLLVVSPSDPATLGTVLLAEDTYHLLLPRAERPVTLALEQVVARDLSHAGFLRVDLQRRYVARLIGDETVDGVTCRRLELAPKTDVEPFGRVVYWIAPDGHLPIRIDFYDRSGELLKTARFTDYQATGTGPRPARITIDDAHLPGERTTLTLGPPRGVATSRLAFDPVDLEAAREIARRHVSETGSAITGRRLALELARAR